MMCVRMLGFRVGRDGAGVVDTLRAATAATNIDSVPDVSCMRAAGVKLRTDGAYSLVGRLSRDGNAEAERPLAVVLVAGVIRVGAVAASSCDDRCDGCASMAATVVSRTGE